MRTLLFMGLIGIFTAGCVNDVEEEDPTYSLSFPLTIGKSWQYISTLKVGDSTADSVNKWATITDKLQDTSGFTAFEIKDSSTVGTFATFNYYQKRNDGLYMFSSPPGGVRTLNKKNNTEMIIPAGTVDFWVPLEFKLNHTWNMPAMLPSGETETRTFRFTGLQRIITKAGNFECFKFEASPSSKKKYLYYFSADVGLVMKEEVIDSVAVAYQDPATLAVQNQYKKSTRRMWLVGNH